MRTGFRDSLRSYPSGGNNQNSSSSSTTKRRSTTPTLSSSSSKRRPTSPTSNSTATMNRTKTPTSRNTTRNTTNNNHSATGVSDGETFWKQMLSQASVASGMNNNTPRKQHQQQRSNNNLNTAASHPNESSNNNMMIDVDTSDVVRFEEMLVTGVYQPSFRVQKIEALLSRELELWEHVVGGGGGARNSNNNVHDDNYGSDNNTTNYHHSSFAGSPTTKSTATRNSNVERKVASNAAFNALMAINAQHQHEQQRHQNNNNNNHNTSVDSSSSSDPNLDQEVRLKLARLDKEVSAVDEECQGLISDLMSLQQQQHEHAVGNITNEEREMKAVEVNELFESIQKALTKSQERRERLIEMRQKLLQPLGRSF